MRKGEKEDLKDDLRDEKVTLGKGLIVLLNIVIIVVLVLVVKSYNTTEVESMRNPILDGREENKAKFVNLIEGYITVVDKSSWETRVRDRGFTEEVKSQIYTRSYETFKPANVEEYKFIDVQYTVTDSEYYKMYLSVITKTKGQQKYTVYIASVEDGDIVHVEVY